MGADCSFELISIETYAPQFIGHNEFFLGSVRLLYRSEFLSAKTDDHIQGILQKLIKFCRGRVEQYNPNYSRQLEAILQEIPFKQGGGGHGFSPMSTTPPLMQTSNQTNTVVVMIPRPSQPSLGGTPEGSPR